MPRCMYISGLLDLYMQRVAYIDGTRCIYSSNNKLFQYLLHPCINSWQNLLLTGMEGDKEIFKFYRELLMAKINDEPHHYHREVMQYLFSAIFCEMLGHLNKEVNPSEMTVDTKESIK